MNSIEWMLKNPIQDILDLDFTYETMLFGQRYTVSLRDPGEENQSVTDENKKDYIKRLIYHRLVKEIEGPVKAFKEGFHRFVNPEYLKVFTVAELDKLIAGDPTIDFEEFKTNTHYEGGYSAESDQIVWFWDTVKDFDQESLSALWFFGTGNDQNKMKKFNFNRSDSSRTWRFQEQISHNPEDKRIRDLTSKESYLVTQFFIALIANCM